MSKVNFKAKLSGDHESFCFDVTKEEYKRIRGKNPTKYEKSMFNKGLYRIYPGHLFMDIEANKDVEIFININEDAESAEQTNQSLQYGQVDFKGKKVNVAVGIGTDKFLETSQIIVHLPKNLEANNLTHMISFLCDLPEE